MKTKQYVDGELYAFMTYLHTKKALEAGSIFVKDSINYRSLNDELIPIKTWKEKKDSILRKINNPLLLTPIDKILLDVNLHGLTPVVSRQPLRLSTSFACPESSLPC